MQVYKQWPQVYNTTNGSLKMLYDFSAKLIEFNTLVPISIFR